MEGRHRGGWLRKVMDKQDDEKAPDIGGPALGVFLIALAGAALLVSRGIEQLGMSVPGDPGSKAFPIGLALILIAGGVHEIARWVQSRKQSEKASAAFDLAAFKNGPAGRLGLISLSLTFYVWLLGPLGFASATLAFCIPWMRRLGSRWWVSSVFAVALVVAIEILFDGVFQVQLPKGDTILAIDRFMMNL